MPGLLPPPLPPPPPCVYTTRELVLLGINHYIKYVYV